MRYRHGVMSVTGAIAAAALTACSALPGSTGDTGTAQKPEETKINIGISPLPSAAPVFYAIKKGYFKAEGLDEVTTEVIQDPQSVIPKIQNESIDIFKGSYVSLLNIQGQGKMPLKIISDTLQGTEGIAGVVVPANSKIVEPGQLRNKRIAVNSINNLGTLSMSAHLRIYGVSPKAVKFTKVDFEKQIGELKSGKVDAAWLVEPFLSAAQQAGMELLIDTNSGPTERLPIDGWAVTSDWAKKYPNTAQAASRAIAKAQRAMAKDRGPLAEAVPDIPGYEKIPKEAVLTMAMGTFPTSVNPARIQRVSDLMHEFKYLKNEIDVDSMIYSPKERG